jgi:hypothetical protein
MASHACIVQILDVLDTVGADTGPLRYLLGCCWDFMLDASIASFAPTLQAKELVQEVLPFSLPDIDEATADQVLAILRTHVCTIRQ